MLKGIMFTEYFREALAIYTNRNLIKGKKKNVAPFKREKKQK